MNYFTPLDITIEKSEFSTTDIYQNKSIEFKWNSNISESDKLKIDLDALVDPLGLYGEWVELVEEIEEPKRTTISIKIATSECEALSGDRYLDAFTNLNFLCLKKNYFICFEEVELGVVDDIKKTYEEGKKAKFILYSHTFKIK